MITARAKYKAEWYQRNKARILAHRRGNPTVQEWNRSYYQKTKSRRKEMRKHHKIAKRSSEYYKAWRLKSGDAHRQYHRSRYAENRIKMLSHSKKRHEKQRIELRDCYIRQILSDNSETKPSEWPADLVELKRAQLKVKRLCRKSQTTTN
tara:strand:+ start:545 stop:994 length:450 start_codon:yes stop_codon:yes gene_type:complete